LPARWRAAASRAQAAATTTLLSGPHVASSATTPDGAFVVFQRSQSYDGPRQIYRVPIGGGTPVALSPAGQSAGLVTITADSQSVVYLVSGNTPSAGLYLVPMSGGEPIRLNVPATPAGTYALARGSADRRYVLYGTGDDASKSGSALYSVALDTQQVVRLTAPAPAGQAVTAWFITPNSRYAIFWIGTDTVVTYYAVPLAGGAPVRLFGPAERVYSGLPYATPDSSLIFIQQHPSAAITTVDVVSPDGGPPHALVPDLPPNTTVDLLGVSADSKWAVVKTTTNFGMPGFTYKLLSIRLDESGAPVELLSGSAQTGFLSYDIHISDDAQWVVYTLELPASGGNALYSVPLSGGTPRQLNVPPASSPPNTKPTTYISSDSQWVVFFGSDLGPEHIYSVPIAGSSTPIAIDTPRAQGANLEESFLQFTPDGRYLLYRGEAVPAGSGFHYDLFATPTDGSSPARLLNDPALFVAGYPYNFGLESSFQVAPDSRHVLFPAGVSQDGVRALYVSDLGVSGGITIQHLVRGDVPAGSAGFLLAIDGANFVLGTAVEWDGQIRPATFVNDRRINVSIDAADLTAAGPIPVRAVTPGNDRSNVVYFFVTPVGQPLAHTSVYVPLTQW
jgi:Tol biopolymer transport system component